MTVSNSSACSAFSGLDDELDISPEAEEDEFRKLPTDGTLPDSESQVGVATVATCGRHAVASAVWYEMLVE